MKIIKLEQRTPEWHAWRNGADLTDGPRITATMAAIISGRSPWATPHKLWLEMTGRVPPAERSSYQQARIIKPGEKIEAEARAAYIRHTGNDMHDACIQSDQFAWAGASLDGLSDFGDIALEIKKPGKQDHAVAMEGRVPDKYFPQVQWQLFCGDGSITKVDYWSYYVDESGRASPVLVEVLPDPVFQAELHKQCDLFRQCVFNGVPLAGTAFEQACHIWLLANRKAEQEAERANVAKAKLLALAPEDQRSISEGGVLITRSERSGNVAYKEIFATLVKEGVLTQERVDELTAQNRAKPTAVTSVKASTDAERVLSELDAMLGGRDPLVHGISTNDEPAEAVALTW